MAHIRASAAEDLPALSECHASAFPNALSTRLGRRFVQKMLEWYLVSERGVLFHIEGNGGIAGYCAGIRIAMPGLPGAFTSISQYAFWVFVRAYLRRPWLLLDPENVRKRSGIVRNILMRVRLHRRASPMPESASRPFEPLFGLVALGVASALQSQGYGAALLQHFETLAVTEGIHLVQLSVKMDNQKAIAFYIRNGWFCAERTGDAMVMRKDLSLTRRRRAAGVSQ